MAYVRPAKPADATELAPNLRQADRDELCAATGQPPELAILEGILNSEAHSIVHNDHVIAVFGCASVDQDYGKVWMVGAEALSQIARQFMRESRDYINGLLTRFKVIGNCIDERNTDHIRWLKFNGFTFIRRLERYGHEERPFLEFVKICATSPQSLSSSP